MLSRPGSNRKPRRPPQRPRYLPRWRSGHLLLGALGTVLLTGCADAGDQETRALQGLPEFCREALPRVQAHQANLTQPTGERFGGTVVAGAIGEMADGINAFSLADYTGAQHQTFLNLMTLVRLGDSLEPEPYLAERWEFSQDGTELTFHLRNDIRWHDGEPTTAHDVAFTFLRASDPETAFPNAAFWTLYREGMEGVEVLDDHTVRFRFEPHAEALDVWRAMPIMPRHLLEDVAPSDLRTHPFGTRCPVGNGPFVFQERRPGQSWTFVRNPDFPDGLGGPPYLDRYVFRVIPEQSTLLAELLTGGVDIYLAPTPDQALRIQAEEGLQVVDFDFRSYVFVAWNSRRPHLSDPRVRQALTMGTNRQEILDGLLLGFGMVADAGVPPFHWAHDPDVGSPVAYDPEGAAALLEEAGWRLEPGASVRRDAQGNPLEISIKYNTGNRQRQEIAEVMQAQLARIGVVIRPEVLEWATLVEQINDPVRRDFDGVVLGWVTEMKVDDRDLFHSSRVDRPFQWSGIQDPDLDLLLDSLQVITDRAAARPLWERYQERVVELQPFTHFFFPRRLAGVNERVEGVRMDVRGEWVTAHEWWIPETARGGR